MIDSHHINYYDMFCDHGKIGLAIIKRKQQKNVYFVDIKPHLIQELKHKNSINDLANFVTADAKKLTIADSSFVVLCGVGGNLIIECLNRYIRQENRETLTFLISANMHTLEIKHYLSEGNYHLLHQQVAIEHHRCYEIFLVQYSENYEKKSVQLFNENLWSRNDKDHQKYLQSKLKDLSLKKELKGFEKKYQGRVKDFL